MIDKNNASVSTKRQCELIGLNRSTYYYEPNESESDLNQELMRIIDQLYTENPFYGSRRMVILLKREFGIKVSRERVSRLMRIMGIEGQLPGKKTTRRHQGHKVYPYLLKNLEIVRPDQVWCSDITYIPVMHGTMYLVAIMDWYSRKILAWELSNTLDTSFALKALDDALSRGKPEIFHSDQGCQYTSHAFTQRLKDHGITISMSGRGRAYDNIFIERFWRSLKTEEVYKNEYNNVIQLRRSLEDYIHFYNTDRPHAALEYLTPYEVHNVA